MDWDFKGEFREMWQNPYSFKYWEKKMRMFYHINVTLVTSPTTFASWKIILKSSLYKSINSNKDIYHFRLELIN